MNTKSSFDVVDTADRSKWAEAHSDWERFFPWDLFFVSMTTGLVQKITSFDRDWKDWAFYFVLLTLLFIVLAIQLNELFLFLPTVLLDLFYPFLIFGEWFGRIFGVSYAPMIAIIIATGLLYESLRIHGMAAQARKLIGFIKGFAEERSALFQLYSGGGSLRFSYGQNGLFINGSNIHTYVAWQAFSHSIIVRVETETIKTSKGISPEAQFVNHIKGTENVEEATHLLLYLKVDGYVGTPMEEFIAIPRAQFFPTERTAMKWHQFVAGIKTYVPLKTY